MSDAPRCIGLYTRQVLAQRRLSPKAIRLASERAKALADPTRMAIAGELRRIYPDRMGPEELAEAVDRDKTVVSRHCKRMRRTGLISQDIVSTYAIYQLTEAGLELLDAVLKEP